MSEEESVAHHEAQAGDAQTEGEEHAGGGGFRDGSGGGGGAGLLAAQPGGLLRLEEPQPLAVGVEPHRFPREEGGQAGVALGQRRHRRLGFSRAGLRQAEGSQQVAVLVGGAAALRVPVAGLREELQRRGEVAVLQEVQGPLRQHHPLFLPLRRRRRRPSAALVRAHPSGGGRRGGGEWRWVGDA